jgi:hypothetical protein
MRFFISFLCLFLCLQSTLWAQKVNFSPSTGASLTKEWRWKKKFTLEAKQSIQINFEQKNQDEQFGDVFNELDFMPLSQDTELDSDDDGIADRIDTDDDNDGVNDEEDKDDDDGNTNNDDDKVNEDDSNTDEDGNTNNDDDNNDGDGNTNNDDDDDDDDGGGLTSGNVDDRNNPDRAEIGKNDWFMEWRASTALRAEWRILKWLRLSGNYGVFYGGNETRHRLGTELRAVREIGNLELSGRLSMLHFAAKDKGEWGWEHAMVPRVEAEYKILPMLNAYLSPSLNGKFEDDGLDFDRYRLDLGFQWRINKQQILDLGYRFQQRIGGKKTISHGLGLTYGYRF